jgi:hypothetical protein
MAFAPHLHFHPFIFRQDSDQTFVLSSALVGWMLFVHYTASGDSVKQHLRQFLWLRLCPDLHVRHYFEIFVKSLI